MREGTQLLFLCDERPSLLRSLWLRLRGQLHDGMEVLRRGTVIGIRLDEDGDGNDFVEEAQVQFDDGFIAWVERDELDYAEDVTPKLWVNLYMHDRVYGGPEEGGWFYSTLTPFDPAEVYEEDLRLEGVKAYATEREAKRAYEALLEWEKEANASRRDVSSVISEGVYSVQWEAFPPTAEPQRKPHYC